ncbi:immunity 49 family protein [Streptomyces sp. 796.1]|uniref:immunity 49 family protein n=1 Tax=Streptomyces sp. 796.1 TaxID=3163029 RepID=UPI0039C9E973
MPTQISRDDPSPPVDRSEIFRIVEGGVEKRLIRLENSPRMFGLTLGIMESRARLHLLHDPHADKVETWEAWMQAAQVGSALFAAATAAPGTTVSCRIAEKMRTFSATGPQHFTDAGNWLTAFWMAITCRDQPRMDQLCQVPISLLRESGAIYDEYIYDWVDSLQTYWTERPGLSDKFVRAFKGADPDDAPIAGRELMLRLLYPPLNLFYRFLDRDHAGFNTALVQALQLHKAYWTANEERMETADGAVALDLLAIACLAYDAGFPIDVESEYLPSCILDRSWVGEFDM